MRRQAVGMALVLAVLAVAAATAVAVDGDVKCAECGTGAVPVLPPPPPYYYYSPPPPAATYPGTVSNCPPPPGGYIAIGGSPPGRMYPQDPGFMPSSAPPRHGISFAAVPFTVCALAALATLRAFW